MAAVARETGTFDRTGSEVAGASFRRIEHRRADPLDLVSDVCTDPTSPAATSTASVN